MDTVSHTPGPWVPSAYGYQVLTGDSWNTVCVLHEKGNDYRLASWEDGRAAATAEANARLIAAAPDLLAALAAVDAHFGPFAEITVNGSHDPDDVRVIAMVRAAIQKAESHNG